MNFLSTAELRYEKEATKLREENSELTKKVAGLDEEVAKRTKLVEELLDQKAALVLKLKAMESKLSGYEVTKGSFLIKSCQKLPTTNSKRTKS